ncbi:phosphatase PAP2 family protein [Sorangium sp. So ce1151]|uniref:phosphatase PAP2 family protein n=1 Tax=Sorangium sp. So ce1151 TaxID=3133332 RepID=UPI003F60BD0F
MHERLTTDCGKVAGSRGLVDVERAGALWRDALRGLVAVFALQDVILIGYLMATTIALVFAPASEVRTECVQRNLVGIAALMSLCVFVRRATFVAPLLRSVVYRLSLVGAFLLNYLSLRTILPTVRSDSLDAELLHLDLLLFRVEPALWMERFNTRPIVEWFSFFYFSYFLICFMSMVLALWVARPGRGTTEYAIGTSLVYCLGQLGYMAVPAYGPIQALRHLYEGPLDGGFFWGAVSSVVQAGGAMKDVFPSLHTAGPLWFALYTFHRARTDRRLFWLAVVAAFFSMNIIISTMLLRWHYAVDVVAGIALASGTAWLTPRLVRWEEAFRTRMGQPHPWTFR